jgi:acyl-CoA synthetase (AMP-forming)/AMP-acid ligase II
VELVDGAEASEEDLIAYCKGTIAGFKVPRYVRFVDGWPMSGTKIKKFQLREDLLRELGIDAPA